MSLVTMSESSNATVIKKKLTPEQRSKKREAAKVAVELLSEAYPEVFDLKNPRPLKIGIHESLAEDGKVSKTKIRRALSAYVRHYAYLSCLKEGAMRIDLDGSEVAPVSAEEAQHATEKVAEVEKIRQEKQQKYEQRKQAQVRRKEKEKRISQKLEALVAKSTSVKN
ncbi:activator of osmoprotectant transporter ProP [Gynuella sunshinyii YC6258]|uniref:Activator of osmoprotectant transporter ProP n=2 Tax=Gynuella sunshinyii TaxID=1445505 RepID=A0A0C5VVC6_9GAMM|nr:activator of osmoprotectant transporter ProP [Gynuella sunshinyii YC6258]